MKNSVISSAYSARRIVLSTRTGHTGREKFQASFGGGRGFELASRPQRRGYKDSAPAALSVWPTFALLYGSPKLRGSGISNESGGKRARTPDASRGSWTAASAKRLDCVCL